MKEIFDAQVAVATHKTLREYGGEWFCLSDYADLGEFLAACDKWFGGGHELLFMGWENIPDSLITKRNLNPMLFEIRDALERLDEEDIDGFLEWCNYNGHDLTTDDPLLLVTRYMDTLQPQTDFRGEEEADDDPIYPESALISMYFGGVCGPEIFNDNYD